MTGLNKNTVKRIDKKRLKVLYTETDENGNTVLKKILKRIPDFWQWMNSSFMTDINLQP